MTIRGKLKLIALGILLALLAGVVWLLGSESGARFVLARAAPHLPAELKFRYASGSLSGGVCLESLSWSSESLDATVRDACVEIEVARLLSRHLAVRSLDVEEVQVVSRPVPDDDSPDKLPAIESPLRISIDAALLRNLAFEHNQLSRTIDRLQFAGELSGSSLDVSQLVLRSNWLNAELDGSIELAEFYRGNLDVEWQWTDAASIPLAGNLSLRGDLRRFALEHTLSAPQAVTTTGHFSYAANELDLDLENTWAAIQWEIGESLLQSRNGSLRLKGSLDKLDIALNAHGRFDELPETEVTLEGTTDLESIDVSSLVASNDLGRLAAAGSAGWCPTTHFDFEYAVADLDPAVASARLQGEVHASGTVSGTFGTDTHELAVRVRKLGGLVNGQALDGNGAFTHTPDLVKVAESQVRLGENSLSVRGAAGSVLSLDATLALPEIHALSPVAAGSLTGSMKLRGSRERPEVHIEASGSGLAWNDNSIGTVVVDSKGVYAEGRWAGVVNALSLENEVAGKWSMRDAADLAVSSREFTLSRTCLVRSIDPTSICAEVSLDAVGATHFDLELMNLPLAVLPLTLPANVSLSGLGNLQARGSIADGRVAGTGSLALQDARLDAIVDDEEISAVLARASGQATVTDNRLVSSLELELADDAGDMQANLAIDDVLDTSSAITGQGKLELKDMLLFAVLIPDISKPRGLIRGDVDVSGSLLQPEFLGATSISDGAFGVRRAGVEIVDLNVRASQTDVGRMRLEGSARSGAGHIDIQGDTWASANTGIRSELLITGQDFELSRLPDWQVAASPSIAVVFDDYKTSVTGNLFIPSTNVRLKELPESAISPSSDAVVHGAEEEQPQKRRQVHIDIAVGLGEEVFFSGFGLSTGIEGAVRLQGGTQTPLTGSGRLSLREGIYKAYGQDLEIERGQLIFNGPLDNPQLDIRAVRRTTDVVAGIQIAGTPSQLRSSVFSEPALRDAEALSYLLTGRPLAGATSSGEGDMLNAAAFALGVSSAGNIVSQVRSGLGLETLAIEGGAEDGRLIAGKRFGDRLLVEYGYGLVDKLGTLLLRYQLTDRLVLESRTGTVSNFDIVYKVKKK